MDEAIMDNLKATMSDTKKRGKIFLALCGVPVAANEVNLMMKLIDQAIHPMHKDF